MNLEEYLGEQLHDHWRLTHQWLLDRCARSNSGVLVVPARLAEKLRNGLGRAWGELTAEEQREERARAIAMIARLKEEGHVSIADRDCDPGVAVRPDDGSRRDPGAGTK